MGRKRFAAGVVAAAAIMTVTTAGTAASSASAAPTGIPNYLVSAVAIDQVNHTATLPLFQGEAPHLGRVWFILTESSNLADAERLGINWSPKLANALGTPAVQPATLEDGGGHSQFGRNSDVNFSAGVNFSGQRLVVPGPDLFPVDPATHAGPVGQRGYSPLFTFGDGVVFNGAEIANRTGVHQKVLSLDLHKRQAVVRLTAGFYLGRNVLYLSTESSVTQIAALENATYAPVLASAPQAGSDHPSLSAREAIIPIVNGPRGVDNPQRQGLQSAVAGEGDPLNHDPEIDGLRAAGVVVNCPPIFVAPPA